jgi:hypothetical protein
MCPRIDSENYGEEEYLGGANGLHKRCQGMADKFGQGLQDDWRRGGMDRLSEEESTQQIEITKGIKKRLGEKILTTSCQWIGGSYKYKIVLPRQTRDTAESSRQSCASSRRRLL